MYIYTSCWAFNFNAYSTGESSASTCFFFDLSMIGGVFAGLRFAGALCTPTSRFNPTTFFSAQKHPKLLFVKKENHLYEIINKEDDQSPWIRTWSGDVGLGSSWMILTLGLVVLGLLRLWLEGRIMSGAEMVDKFLKDLEFRVLEDKHSIGNSPDKGLQIYFSASCHFEFNSTPSGFNQSQFFLYTVFACNAVRTNKNKKTTKKKKIFYLSSVFVHSRAFSLYYQWI